MAKIITPLKDKVLVEPEGQEAEKTTASGFIVTAKKDENPRPQTGKIIEIGPDVTQVSVGDTVVFKEFIPTNFELDEKKYLILAEEDILAKVS